MRVLKVILIGVIAVSVLVFGAFLSKDDMLGSDYEEGLQRLKVVDESKHECP